MTLKNNRAPLPCYFKLCASFRSHWWIHDDVIEWKHFLRNWPFVRGIHRTPVNSLHKGQWRGALMFSLTCTWINCWVNNGEAGDLRRYRAHYHVIVMSNWSPDTPDLGRIWLFLEPCDLEIWRMTLKNNRAPLLCYFKLCADGWWTDGLSHS